MLISLLTLLACSGQTTQDSGLDASAPTRSCEVELRFPLAPGASTVEVAGAFNGWTPEPVTSTELADDGQTELGVVALGSLEPGTYPWKVLWDGAWETPPANTLTMFHNGVENRALTVPDCNLPGLEAISGTTTAEGTLRASFQFTRAVSGSPPSESSLAVLVGDAPVTASLDPVTGIIDVEVSGLAAGKHTVTVSLTDADGHGPEQGIGWLPLWVEPEPFDWADGAMYFAFTDRFRDAGPSSGDGDVGATVPGVGYLGGDLTGTREALEEGWFEELGVRSLWLSPVYDGPDQAFSGSFEWQFSGYHGYWPVHPTRVDPRWGAGETGEEALAALVDAAHDQGIRVVLDLVLNHVHEDHVWLEEHPEWFGAEPCPCQDGGPCDWNANPTQCWFTGYLPDLDHREHAIVEQAVADVQHWLHTYDVDGFRVDAAKHMEHVVMRTIAQRLDADVHAAGGAKVLLIGETFTGSGQQDLIMEYVAEHELDGQFDFPLFWRLRDALRDEGSFVPLADEVRASQTAYGTHTPSMSVFLGNHDVSRFVTDLQDEECDSPFGGCPDLLSSGSDGADRLAERLEVAWGFVLTQPGPPLIYYGDELGLAGGEDPDNRRLMPWGNLSSHQERVLEHTRTLGQLRAGSEALRRGQRRTLLVNDDVYVYARDAGGGEVAIVALTRNHSGSITVPVEADLALDGVALTDALGGSTATVGGGSVALALEPWSVAVWVR